MQTSQRDFVSHLLPWYGTSWTEWKGKIDELVNYVYMGIRSPIQSSSVTLSVRGQLILLWLEVEGGCGLCCSQSQTIEQKNHHPWCFVFLEAPNLIATYPCVIFCSNFIIHSILLGPMCIVAFACVSPLKRGRVWTNGKHILMDFKIKCGCLNLPVW